MDLHEESAIELWGLVSNPEIVWQNAVQVQVEIASLKILAFRAFVGTGQIGKQVALGDGFTEIALFTAQVGQNGVVAYGGQAGLNVAW